MAAILNTAFVRKELEIAEIDKDLAPTGKDGKSLWYNKNRGFITGDLAASGEDLPPDCETMLSPN